VTLERADSQREQRSRERPAILGFAEDRDALFEDGPGSYVVFLCTGAAAQHEERTPEPFSVAETSPDRDRLLLKRASVVVSLNAAHQPQSGERAGTSGFVPELLPRRQAGLA
jgi:hypothetical protein